MELTPEQVEELEAVLAQIEDLDPAQVPEPAAQLADVLSRILEALSSE